MTAILLVDDDQMVQGVTKELLEVSGYEVFGAESGGEALELLKREGEKISLVLLDLSLPDVSGLDLLPKLTAIRPDIRVVVCTGTVYEGAADLTNDPAVKGILQKPFDLNSLKDAVQNYLTA